jgi:hypothetical protein
MDPEIAKVVEALAKSAPVALAAPQAIAFVTDILGRVCRPVADDVGTGLAERHQLWRLRNLAAALRTTEQRLAERAEADRGQADPRVVLSIVDYASVVSAPELQEMWGGLLAASCSDRPDDENVVFVNLLSQMTSVQARLLKYASENCRVRLGGHGLLYPAETLYLEPEELRHIAEIESLHRIDRELDQLRNLGLIDQRSGFDTVHHGAYPAHICPTVLGLALYARGKGSNAELVDFFKLSADHRSASAPI